VRSGTKAVDLSKSRFPCRTDGPCLPLQQDFVTLRNPVTCNWEVIDPSSAARFILANFTHYACVFRSFHGSNDGLTEVDSQSYGTRISIHAFNQLIDVMGGWFANPSKMKITEREQRKPWI
jgi:hypothetical protein